MADYINFRPVGIPDLTPAARLVLDAGSKANPMAAFANIGTALGNFQDSRVKDLDWQKSIWDAQQQLINQQRVLDPEIALSNPEFAAEFERQRANATKSVQDANNFRLWLRSQVNPHVFTALDDSDTALKNADASRKSAAETNQANANAAHLLEQTRMQKMLNDANIPIREKEALIAWHQAQQKGQELLNADSERKVLIQQAKDKFNDRWAELRPNQQAEIQRLIASGNQNGAMRQMYYYGLLDENSNPLSVAETMGLITSMNAAMPNGPAATAIEAFNQKVSTAKNAIDNYLRDNVKFSIGLNGQNIQEYLNNPTAYLAKERGLTESDTKNLPKYMGNTTSELRRRLEDDKEVSSDDIKILAPFLLKFAINNTKDKNFWTTVLTAGERNIAGRDTIDYDNAITDAKKFLQEFKDTKAIRQALDATTGLPQVSSRIQQQVNTGMGKLIPGQGGNLDQVILDAIQQVGGNIHPEDLGLPINYGTKAFLESYRDILLGRRMSLLPYNPDLTVPNGTSTTPSPEQQFLQQQFTEQNPTNLKALRAVRSLPPEQVTATMFKSLPTYELKNIVENSTGQYSEELQRKAKPFYQGRLQSLANTFDSLTTSNPEKAVTDLLYSSDASILQSQLTRGKYYKLKQRLELKQDTSPNVSYYLAQLNTLAKQLNLIK